MRTYYLEMTQTARGCVARLGTASTEHGAQVWVQFPWREQEPLPSQMDVVEELYALCLEMLERSTHLG